MTMRPFLHELSPAARKVVKAKSAEGFIPNGWASTRKSTHSQPPVGSKVLLEMYRKYGDAWLVELLFDDLLDWSNWFYTSRLCAAPARAELAALRCVRPLAHHTMCWSWQVVAPQHHGTRWRRHAGRSL